MHDIKNGCFQHLWISMQAPAYINREKMHYVL